jgi:hypothetical protein
MHSVGVELVPSDDAVLSIHFAYSGDGRLHDCGGDAYKWNRTSQIFDFSSGLSRRLGKDKCNAVPSKIG